MTALRDGGSAPSSGTVWDQLVGQQHAVTALASAAGGHGMSHAWLFTGPPGSGRSNAAIAFAAALQCEQAGCGYRADERQDQSGNSCDISVSRILEELREAHKLAGNHQDWAGSRTTNLPGSAGNMRSLLVSLPRV